MNFYYCSVERAKFWVAEVQKNEENCRLYLCGTKLDLVEEDKTARRVDFHDVSDYGNEVIRDCLTLQYR